MDVCVQYNYIYSKAQDWGTPTMALKWNYYPCGWHVFKNTLNLYNISFSIWNLNILDHLSIP